MPLLEMMSYTPLTGTYHFTSPGQSLPDMFSKPETRSNYLIQRQDQSLRLWLTGNQHDKAVATAGLRVQPQKQKCYSNTAQNTCFYTDNGKSSKQLRHNTQ